MFQPYRISLWTVALAAVVAVSGCGSSTPHSQEKPKTTAPSDNQAQEKPAGQEQRAGHEGHDDTTGPNALPGLAELSAEDRAAAEKQRVCPVSGDLLGAMGKPVKVVVKGQTVFLCCPNCKKEITQDPDKYLAKLKASQAK
jgi:YHS domain-containing protein